MLLFDELRRANVARQKLWDQDAQIDNSYRGNEMAGETGEALEAALYTILLGAVAGRASNIIKKLERERLGIRGSKATTEDLGKELADVVICVDLLAMAYKIDLGGAVVKKFNETSEKVGLPTRL